MPKTIQLVKPMTVNGKSGAEEITALEFRDPTALDLRRLGQPFKIFLHPDKRQEYEVNYDVLFRWFGHLSGRGSDDVAAAITLAQTDELKEWLSDALSVGRDEKN